MDDHLQQFKNLPHELREAVSSEEKIKFLEEIEKKYNLKLTKLVVRVMIKDISWLDLEKFLGGNFNLTSERARELKKDLTEKIFDEVLGYLNEDNRLKIKDLSGKEKIEIDRNIPPAVVKYAPVSRETEQSAAAKQIEIDRNISRPDVGTKPAFVETTAGEAEIDFKKIAQEAKNVLTTMTPMASLGLLDLGKIIREMKQKLNLVFEDEILEHRFESIIRSYFREVRNEVQTEETLRRAKKIGGLEFLPEKAALVIRIIKEFKGKIATTETQKISESQSLQGKQIETDRNMLRPDVGTKYAPLGSEIDKNLPRQGGTKQIETEKLEEKLEEKPKVDVSTETLVKVDEDITKRFESGPILPSFKKIEPPFVPQSGTTEGKKLIEPPAAAKYTPFGRETGRNLLRPAVGAKQMETKRGISIQIKQPISEEKLVEDIYQGAPRAIGPVEELAEITPLDLQRWGGGKNTTQIILDKINLLQEISLVKKDEGINAWKRSPLYKFYLAVGQQALEQKKSVQQIIREKENNNQPFLRVEDFEAINELNQKLRF